MTRRSGIAGAAALVALLTMASSGWAQVTTASVTGTRQGPAGGRRPRRGRHADQRNTRHADAGRVHQRQRRLHVRQRLARPVHGAGDDGRVQDAASAPASSSARATGCRSAPSRLKSAGSPTPCRSRPNPPSSRRRAASDPSRSIGKRSRTCRLPIAASWRSPSWRPACRSTTTTRRPASAAAAIPTS